METVDPGVAGAVAVVETVGQNAVMVDVELHRKLWTPMKKYNSLHVHAYDALNNNFLGILCWWKLQILE